MTVAPMDLELERVVLGAALHSADVARQVAALESSLFELDAHALIHEALRTLVAGLDGAPPTPSLLRSTVERAGHRLDPTLLATLADEGYNVVDVRPYVGRLREVAAARHYRAVMPLLTEADAEGWSEDTFVKIERALERARALRTAGPGPAFTAAVTLPALFADPPTQPAWLVEGLILQGANGWLGAGAKVGKSYLALDLLLAAALGEPWLGQFTVPRPLTVVLVEEEDSRWRVYERLDRLCRGRGAPPPASFHVTVRAGLRLDDTAGLDGFLRWLDPVRPDLVVWDVFNLLHTQDEKRPDQMLPLLRRVDRIRDELGCANLIAHHSRKPGASGPDLASGGQRLRGPSEFWGWAENSLYLKPTKTKGAVVVEPESKDAIVEPFKAHLEDLAADARRWVYDGVVEARLAAGATSRQRIVEALEIQPLPVESLASATGLSPRTVKGHLKALEAEGIVTGEREPGKAGRKAWRLVDGPSTPRAEGTTL
jgi:DNA-binding transcriptional ArsR family regulator